MTPVRLIARPLLATTFFVGATSALKNSDKLAAKAGKVTERLVPLVQRAAPGAPVPTNPRTLIQINAGLQLAAAAALALGKAPRLSSSVLAVSLVPTTVAGYAFWEESDPEVRSVQKLHFFKNVSVLGGLLLAGVDTEGKPGLAWRARNAATTARKDTRTMAKSARKDARHLAKDVRREAKLAKAQLS